MNGVDTPDYQMSIARYEGTLLEMDFNKSLKVGVKE
jgi:hypothetical protein